MNSFRAPADAEPALIRIGLAGSLRGVGTRKFDQPGNFPGGDGNRAVLPTDAAKVWYQAPGIWLEREPAAVDERPPDP